MRFIKTLQAEGITLEKYRQRIRDQIVIVALRQRNVSSEIIISPYKIQTFYQAHKEDYKIEEEIKLRMIVLTNTAQEARMPVNLAEEIVTKLNEGASFTEMAGIYSQGSQRRENGDWGWVEKKVLRKELVEAAGKLNAGQHSGVIETHDPDSFYIMLVEDKRPVHYKPMNDVREDIEKALMLEERSRLEKQWVAKLKKKTFVKYFLAGYSHSIVPGGLLVMSKQTRLTPLTSLMMRLESFSSRSYGSFTQSAVMPSCDSTARMAMV